MKNLRYGVLALAVTIFTTISVAGIKPNLEKTVDEAKCSRWVDSVYNSLTPRERVAQLIFPKFVPTRGDKSRDMLKSLVEINQVGGLLFTEGTLEQYVEMTNLAQSMAKVPLLMVFDGEWGLSMRIGGTPRFPRNMALGAVDDAELMYAYGREMARECRLVGIPVNFAPVVDVNTNPLNPVIGDRSFGSDPRTVSRLALAYSKGLEDGGVQAVAKHFPGHGDTDSDSHKTLPTVNYSYEYLDTTHLIPFKDFIDGGLSGIMTAHLTMPQLDASLTPASLSQPITTGLLRGRMGFDGLIYTDALSMRGARIEGKNNAVLAIRAGADVLESSISPVVDIEEILKAIDKGELTWPMVEACCKKILKYKYILGLPDEKPIVLERLLDKINTPEAEALNRRLSSRAITLIRNNDDILPIGNLAKNRIAVVEIGKKGAREFASTCGKYANVEVFDSVTAENARQILANDVVIAAVTSANPKDVDQLSMIDGAKNLVVAFLIDPYKIKLFNSSMEKAKAVLLAYDDSPLLQEYSAQAAFGGVDVVGKLPVALDGIADRGAGMQLKKSRLGFSSPLNEGLKTSMTGNIDSIIAQAIEQGAFPGCQILVAKNGNVVLNKSYGAMTAGGAPVTDSTLYDLASVSKALGTLPSVMKGYDLGLFQLDEPASKYIPGLAAAGKDFTVKELLFHETGMPAGLNMYEVMGAPGHKGFGNFEMRTDIAGYAPTAQLDITADDGIYVGRVTYDSIMSTIYNIPLRQNKDYNYSCLNFCLLMDLNQRTTGIDHQSFSTDSIFAPLGAWTTGYRPLERFTKADIAPTEIDSVMRKQLVHGYVHDELANFSGGVQGNAGLFSNALDLAKICQMWLNGGEYGDVRILSPETVELFTTTKSPTCRRGLGFDKPDTENPDDSPTCAEADPSVYGHLGFTGTIFWVDPKNDVIFIFLNNRVNPSRNNRAFSRLNPRPALFREVYKAMEN